MTKELEALNKIQHDFGQLKGQELVSCYETIFNALKRLESIDNANPSEALECLDRMNSFVIHYALEDCPNTLREAYFKDYTTIKQALLKAQEPKHYLKWEDLEFNRKEAEYMKVSLNGTKYCLVLTWGFCEPKMVKVKPINLYEEKETEGQTIFLLDGNYINDKQFFNDLHLERVEE